MPAVRILPISQFLVTFDEHKFSKLSQNANSLALNEGEDSAQIRKRARLWLIGCTCMRKLSYQEPVDSLHGNLKADH